MFEVGNTVFIRTVTYHTVGRVTARDGDWLTLEDASWVADSGRFGEAIATGDLNEVERVGACAVNLAAAVDVFPWAHELPSVSK